MIPWKTFEEFSLEMNLRNTIQKDELVDIRWYRMLIIPISVIDIHDEYYLQNNKKTLKIRIYKRS